jgi:single-strand DNA-binding protein
MYQNRLTIIGFCGTNPELRQTPMGTSVTRFSVATKESWKDAEGNRKESTEWHTIIAWGRLAEIAHEILKKGSHVQVEGPKKTREYTKDEQKHTITELKARTILKLDRAVTKEEPVQPGEEEDHLPF